jgi:hypothetical protein
MVLILWHDEGRRQRLGELLINDCVSDLLLYIHLMRLYLKKVSFQKSERVPHVTGLSQNPQTNDPTHQSRKVKCPDSNPLNQQYKPSSRESSRSLKFLALLLDDSKRLRMGYPAEYRSHNS